MLKHPHLVFALACLFFPVAPLVAQEWWATPKKPLTSADYGQFERLGSPRLSADGNFIAWTVTTVAGDTAVQMRRLQSGGPAGEIQRFENARAPQFSRTSQSLGFLIGVSVAAREKLEKSKKPVPSHLGLVDLASGKRSQVDGVRGFGFSADGRFVAARRSAPKEPEGASDVVVRDLKSGTDTVFGHIAEHLWSDDGAWLAMVVRAPDQIGSGVTVFDAASGRLQTLQSAKAHYSSLVWRRDALDLAALRTIEAKQDDKKETDKGTDEAAAKDNDKGAEQKPLVLLTWSGVGGADVAARTHDPRKASGFPPGKQIVAHGGLRWADAGDAVFVNLQNKPTPFALRAAAPGSLLAKLKEPAGVEVWHTKDIDVLPRQKKTLQGDQRRSLLCAVWLSDGEFVVLGDALTENVTLMRKQRAALGTDNTPYETEKRFGPTLVDVYVIDTRSGDKTQILKRCKYLLGSSPDGRLVAYVKEGAVWCYDRSDGSHHDLTGSTTADFINDERKVLTDEPPAYGVAGWSPDGSRVYVHSRWDLWSFATNGTRAMRLTRGAAEQVRHRWVSLAARPHLRDIVDPETPLLVSTYGHTTKKSGFLRLHPGGAPRTTRLGR